jgi:peptidyl-prolyl cis-trans isomerase A (cyclophilin A)
MRYRLLLLSALLAGASMCQAQMYADVQTSAGHFTCELNFEETPRTVANFVSLAEGTRQWVDERDGQLSTISPPQPFYDNTIFHRVVQEEGFKIIQGGSKRGDGTDGPGYEFPDEMNVNTPATYRFNQPYRLAMANSGPNTNGSQFFLTGEAMEGLEGKHTVFGKVVSGQQVVQAILESAVDANERPLEDIVVEKISIRRIGEAARQFKTGAMKLPTLSVPQFGREEAPSPENTERFIFNQGQRSELLAFASIAEDVSDWQKLESRWHAASPYTVRYYDVTYPTDSPVTGFRPVLAKYHTDALTPMTLKGWTLSMENAEGVYLFSFPHDGTMGYMFTPAGGTISQTGTIDAASLHYQASPYHAVAQFELDDRKIIHLHLGFDKKDLNNLHGRCVSRFKHIVITNPEKEAGFYPGAFSEPGGDKGFSMVPIQ